MKKDNTLNEISRLIKSSKNKDKNRHTLTKFSRPRTDSVLTLTAEEVAMMTKMYTSATVMLSHSAKTMYKIQFNEDGEMTVDVKSTKKDE